MGWYELRAAELDGKTDSPSRKKCILLDVHSGLVKYSVLDGLPNQDQSEVQHGAL